MAKTQVSITYGEKTLDCELSFEPPYKLSSFCQAYIASDCELTLESVSIVCTIMETRTGKSITHTEDNLDRDNAVRSAVSNALKSLNLPATVLSVDARERADMVLVMKTLLYSIDPLYQSE